MESRWRIRPLSDSDSIEELTDLLHRAYAPLAERGLHFLATYQDTDTTRHRASTGRCLVATDATGAIVGTVVVRPPKDPPGPGRVATYRKRGVAVFGQYGVDPAWKGRGLGRALHDAAEAEAVRLGATSLACDTAAPAHDLIAMYERWGYRIVERIQWDETNYESVVMEKSLAAAAEETVA